MTGNLITPDPTTASHADKMPRFAWIRWLWAINVFFLIWTFYVTAEWPGELFVRPLTLGSENNVGAWWSGMQLLLIALLLYSLAISVAQTHRQLYLALVALSALAAGMYVDEVGSLHERVGIGLGLTALIPFGIIGVAVLAYGLRGLYLHRDVTGNGWLWILAAFGVFGTVIIQELLEHNLDWTQWPDWVWPSRMVVEEGSELVGFFLFLMGALVMRSRMTPAANDRPLIVPNLLPAPTALGAFMFVGTTLALPVIVLRAPFSEEQLTLPLHGDYGYLIPVMAMILPAYAAIRLAIIDRALRTRWITLTITLIVASVDMCAHMYRYPMRLFGDEDATGLRGYMGVLAEDMWRNDVGLIWVTPLVAAAVLALPALRGLRVIIVALLIMIGGGVSLAVTNPYLILVLCHLATLGTGIWLLQRMDRLERTTLASAS